MMLSKPLFPVAFQWVLLLGAFSLFIVRGPLHASIAGDLATPFVSALRYAQHMDPYAAENFERDWEKAGISGEAFKDTGALRPVYPPSAIILLAPVTKLGWDGTRHLYIACCSLLYIALLLLIAGSIHPSGKIFTWPRSIFLAFGLALSPILTGISKGNLSVLALLLAIGAVLLAARGSRIAAGLALGISCALKPTVGAAFVLYYIAMLNWQVVLVSGASALALFLASARQLQAFAPLWHLHYNENVAFFFGPDGEDKWHGSALSRFDLLDLQLPMYELTHNIGASKFLAYAIFAGLICTWAVLAWRNRKAGFFWSPIAAVSLLCLLPVYQRNYNAGAIVLAIAWAVQNLHRRSARAILLFSAAALFPMEAYLRKSVYHYLPSAVTENVLWRGLVMPQLTWAIVGIVVCLLFAMRHSAEGSRDATHLQRKNFVNRPVEQMS